MGFWKQWSLVRKAKLDFLRFARMDASPDKIAKGLAMGVFIGMIPAFGLQTLLAVLLAFLFKENRLAAVMGVWVSNPFTEPFVYALNYESGRLLLGMPRAQMPDEFSFAALGQLGAQVIGPLWLGGIIYGVLFALVSYALTLRFLPVVKAWRVPRWPRPRLKIKL